MIVSAQLQEIADVIGEVPALRLAEVYGGQERCYVPRTPSPTHRWAQVVGWEAWRALCEHFGGERIDIPRNAFARSKKIRIVELAQRGVSHAEIASLVGCTERWVRSVVNAGAEEGQPELF